MKKSLTLIARSLVIGSSPLLGKGSYTITFADNIYKDESINVDGFITAGVMTWFPFPAQTEDLKGYRPDFWVTLDKSNIILTPHPVIQMSLTSEAAIEEMQPWYDAFEVKILSPRNSLYKAIKYDYPFFKFESPKEEDGDEKSFVMNVKNNDIFTLQPSKKANTDQMFRIKQLVVVDNVGAMNDAIVSAKAFSIDGEKTSITFPYRVYTNGQVYQFATTYANVMIKMVRDIILNSLGRFSPVGMLNDFDFDIIPLNAKDTDMVEAYDRSRGSVWYYFRADTRSIHPIDTTNMPLDKSLGHPITLQSDILEGGADQKGTHVSMKVYIK